MRQTVFIAKGIFWSAALAGPIFLIALGGVSLYNSLPEPITVTDRWLTAESISTILLGIIPTIIVGFIAGILPIVAGASILGNLGRTIAVVRLPIVWVATGIAVAVIPLAIGGALFEPSPVPAAVIITSGMCALLSRLHAKWIDDPVERKQPIRAPASVSPPAQSELGHRNTGARLLD
jgi:hypothetical protein